MKAFWHILVAILLIILSTWAVSYLPRAAQVPVNLVAGILIGFTLVMHYESTKER